MSHSAIRNPQSEIRDRLIVFTRFPEPGKSKTRLIPALGPEGAADLQRQMAERTAAWARRLRPEVSLEVHFEGGGARELRRWLGADLPYLPQGRGDLGARMSRAFRRSFEAGMNRVLLVGTDCPGLSEDLAGRALQALQRSDLVLGPARDGGYYLIGLRRPAEKLFRKIPWGSERVLSLTLQAALRLALNVSLLDPLPDVDRPEDLPVWRGRSAKGGEQEDRPSISIIVPALNEEGSLKACLESAAEGPGVERIVVDGGSRDRTVEVARSCGARVLSAPRGRARQMNAGARAASGGLLLFLHADTLLPPGYAQVVRSTLALPGIAAGAFEFRLDSASPGLSLIERIANWRSRRLQIPYGDQGIFLRASRFRDLGGFPDLPIMEDYEFIVRLRKHGRVYTAPYPAVTSARRWKNLGTCRATLLNEAVLIAYHLGVSPRGLLRLARR